MTIREVATVEVSSDLMEDYEQSIRPAAALNARHCFQSVRRNIEGQYRTDLVTVEPGGGILHISPDASSNSGWAQEIFQMDSAPAPIPTAIDAFASQSTLTVLARYSNADSDKLLAMSHTYSRGWEPLNWQSDVLNALSKMQQTGVVEIAPGHNLIYGISVAFDPATLVIVDTQSPNWSVLYFHQATTGSTYRVLPGATKNALILAEFNADHIRFSQGVIENGKVSFGEAHTVSTQVGDLTATRATPISQLETGHISFIVLTDKNELYRLNYTLGGDLSATSLTGMKLQPAAIERYSVGRLSDGTLLLCALDQPSGRLWLANINAQLFNWVELGDLLIEVAVPTILDDAEAYTFDQQGIIRHLSRHSDNHLWDSFIVKATTKEGEPALVSAYTYDIRALDKNGLPVAGAELEIKPNRPCVLFSEGRSVHTNSKHPITVHTGYDGRVTVASKAGHLSSPLLQVSTQGKPLGESRADLKVHQRLAGLDPAIIITGASLQQAKLLPKKLSEENANKACHALQVLAKKAVQKQTDPGHPMAPVSVHLAVNGHDATVFNPDLPIEEMSIGHFFGDILHFFEHLFEDIVLLVIEVVGDIIKLTLQFADKVLHLIAKTLDEVLKGLGLVLSLFNVGVHLLEDAIEAALALLRVGFNWPDIMDTKKVLKHWMVESLQNVKTDLDLVCEKIKKQAPIVETEIAAGFDQLIKKVDPNLSVGDSVPSSSNPLFGDGNPLLANGLQNIATDHSVRCNYVKNYAAKAFEDHTIPLTANPSMLDSMWQEIEKVLPQGELTDSLEQIKQAAKVVDSPESFLQLILVTLLEAVKDLVLIAVAAAAVIAEALIKIAANAIDALLDLATHNIEVPVISWLYKKYAGDDLTILDLICLMLAAPVTIIYEAIEGGTKPAAPFPNADQIIKQPIPWPGKPIDTTMRLNGNPETDTKVKNIVFMVSIFLYSLEDMNMDLATIEDEPPTSYLTGFSVVTVLTEVLIQGVGYPSFNMEKPAEEWSTITWIVGWTPIVLDIISTIFSVNHTLVRAWGTPGPILVSLTGAGLLGCAATTVNKMLEAPEGDYNAWNQAELLLPTFPLIFQFLVLVADNEVVPPVLLGIDLVGDIGTGVCKLAGA